MGVGLWIEVVCGEGDSCLGGTPRVVGEEICFEASEIERRMVVKVVNGDA